MKNKKRRNGKWWGFQSFNPCLSTYRPQLALSHFSWNATYTKSLFGRHLLGSFNGREPRGPESTIRKWKREPEGGRRGERETERKRKKDAGTQALIEQGCFISRNAGLLSLVRWLLCYYTGWNLINSHNMDSLIYIRSLTLKSHWRRFIDVSFYDLSPGNSVLFHSFPE